MTKCACGGRIVLPKATQCLACVRKGGRPDVQRRSRGRRSKKPCIGLRMDARGDFRVEAHAVSWLGKELFPLYRSTVSGCGFRWDGDRKVNLGDVDLAAVLVRRAKAAGFDVLVEPRVAREIEKQRERVLRAVARMKEWLPQIDEWAMAASGHTLMPFQRTGAMFIAIRSAFRQCAMLGDDKRVGKTIQTLAAAPANVAMTVVCPARAKKVWMRHMPVWRPDLTPIPYEGLETYRWPQRGEVAILNPAILPQGEPLCGMYGAPPAADEAESWLVGDEGQAFKNPDSLQTQRFFRMSSVVRKQFGGTVLLTTASPMMNAPNELWDVLDVAGMAVEAYGNWYEFKDAFGAYEEFDGKLAWDDDEVKDWAVPRLQEVMLRRMKKDVWEHMPETFIERVDCELPKGDAAQFADQVLEQLGELGIGIEEIVQGADLDALTKGDFSKAMKALNASKIPALFDTLDELLAQGKQIVVFSPNRAPIESLAAYENVAGMVLGGQSEAAGQKVVDWFQEGELQIIGLTIGAGSTAIQLDAAADVIFVGRDWVPESNSQAEDRLMSMLQRSDITIWELVSTHRLDDAVFRSNERKRAMITKTVDAASVAPDYESEIPDQMMALLENVRVGPWEPRKPAKRRRPNDNVEAWAVDALIALAEKTGGEGGDLDDDLLGTVPTVAETWARGEGFDPDDEEFARSMAVQFKKKGTLSEKQWPHAVKIAGAAKYRKQVGPKPARVREPGEDDGPSDWGIRDDPMDDIPF